MADFNVDLKTLSVNNPNSEVVTEYCLVSAFKRIRLCSASSSKCIVTLEWTYELESKSKPYCQMHVIPPGNKWVSEPYDVVLPFLRLNIKTVDPAGELTVHVNGLEKVETSAAPETFVEYPNVPDVVVKPAVSRKVIKNGSMSDSRLPQFVPKGSILCGSFSSAIKFLPNGEPGQVLTMSDSGPVWLAQ
jgi:hypothetical protein